MIELAEAELTNAAGRAYALCYRRVKAAIASGGQETFVNLPANVTTDEIYEAVMLLKKCGYDACYLKYRGEDQGRIKIKW